MATRHRNAILIEAAIKTSLLQAKEDDDFEPDIPQTYLRAVGTYFQRAIRKDLADEINRAEFDVGFCEQLESSGFWNSKNNDEHKQKKSETEAAAMKQNKILHDLMFPHQTPNLYDNVWRTLAPNATTSTNGSLSNSSKSTLARATAHGPWRKQIMRYRDHAATIAANQKAAKKRKIVGGCVPTSMIQQVKEKKLLGRGRKRAYGDEVGAYQRPPRQIRYKNRTALDSDDELVSGVSSHYARSEKSEAVTLESFDWDQAAGQELEDLYRAHLQEKKENKDLKRKKTVGWRKGGQFFVKEESVSSDDSESDKEQENGMMKETPNGIETTGLSDGDDEVATNECTEQSTTVEDTGSLLSTTDATKSITLCSSTTVEEVSSTETDAQSISTTTSASVISITDDSELGRPQLELRRVLKRFKRQVNGLAGESSLEALTDGVKVLSGLLEQAVGLARRRDGFVDSEDESDEF